VYLFFFSSRRRHTRFSRDWSSDVCSSDLTELLIQRIAGRAQAEGRADDNPESVRNRLRVYTDQTAPVIDFYRAQDKLVCVYGVRSEERRVGKECRYRWTA